jgi:hypothetical protein
MIEFDRLQKLADFLKELPEEKFDYSALRNESECGTIACAVGWCPEVFPELVKSFKGHIEFLDDSPAYDAQMIAKKLFNLPFGFSRGLFYPGFQEDLGYEFENLGNLASSAQVASLIEKFIKVRKAELEDS